MRDFLFVIGDFVSTRATWVGLLAVLLPSLSLITLRRILCRRGRRLISGIGESILAMAASVVIVELLLHRHANVSDSIDVNGTLAMLVECPLAACCVLWFSRSLTVTPEGAASERTKMNKSKNFLHSPIIAVLINMLVLTAIAVIFALRTGTLDEFEAQLVLRNLMYIPFGIALGLVSHFVTEFTTDILYPLIKDDTRPADRHSSMISEMKKHRWYFVLFALPGWGEELVYRGALQPMFTETFAVKGIGHSHLLGILSAALLFGLMHRDRAGKFLTRQHMVRALSLGLPAALWGSAVYSTGNLWPAILAHGTQGLVSGYRAHKAYQEYEREEMDTIQ